MLPVTPNHHSSSNYACIHAICLEVITAAYDGGGDVQGYQWARRRSGDFTQNPSLEHMAIRETKECRGI